MLLLPPEQLAERGRVASGPLSPLAQSLRSELTPLIGVQIGLPDHKALLSRAGGRCPDCGALLEFDPYSPREHRCPSCGRRHRGEYHDRFWAYWFQLWIAERAVHAAMFAALGAGPEYAALAANVLDQCVAKYADYPNRDNVLGPSRLFFSTYLESIWLLQICVATDLLEQAGGRADLCARVRSEVVAPSRALIAGFDEGTSNRQVWNNAALMASARLLGEDIEPVLSSASGILAHLRDALLPDGSWYEGENYHLFAHRGLWYGVTMAQAAGVTLPPDLVERFDRGFATPFLTALPDFTLPARRDSQYAISLRQWRLAEHTELGFARCPRPELAAALARTYDGTAPSGDTGRWRSAADVERNGPSVALGREDLSWRALLFARPTLPPLEGAAPRSALLPSQGFAVFRRNAGRTYAALDYGHHGGGHGHPDRLNLLLAHDETRWLDDMGTGSYVERALHWYRSTVAHNAPFVNGESQHQVHGELLAYDDRDAVGWVSARARVAPGVDVTRTIVVASEYLIDEVSWTADEPVEFALPLHVNAAVASGLSLSEEAAMPLGNALEDGREFIHDSTVQYAPAGEDVVFTASSDHPDAPALHLCWRSNVETDWWHGVGPAAPGSGERAFWMLTAQGRAGTHRALWSFAESVVDVDLDARAAVRLIDDTTHVHERTATGWRVEFLANGASSSIELGGIVAAATHSPASNANAADAPRPMITLRRGQTWRTTLGEPHYRRSEESWLEAGAPTAAVALTWSGRALSIDIQVDRSDLTFAAATAENPYDNEHPDINGDGVQLYVGDQAWSLVPEPTSSGVRVRELTHAAGPRPAVRWARIAHGYQMHVMLPVADTGTLGIDVLINEMPLGRERRRGQLVLAGAAGEFVYLRGDRGDASRRLTFVLSNA